MAVPGCPPPPAFDDTASGEAPEVSPGQASLVQDLLESHPPHISESRQPEANVPKRKKCPGCNTTDARNLVICIDGTSNQFSAKNTNVVELYSRLVKDKTQLTFYNSGIGTYAKPSWKSWSYRKQVIANTLDLAFALRFENIIISAYAWLVDNYEDGDRIFLFGFSRGAYQVRALAAMIHIVGLLHKGNDDQIPFAYELYAASGDTKKAQMAEAPEKTGRDIRPLPERITQTWSSRQPSFPWPAPGQTKATRDFKQGLGGKDGITMQAQFKRTFSRKDVRVHFVGAWDTVSSVGFIRDKTLPSTTDGMDFVCFFRHALALHEFRVKFLPEYVNGGSGPAPQKTVSRDGIAHTKEVWFTGSHSDIGGGSTTNTSLNKFGPALRWMSWEATLAGLRLVETPDSWEPTGVSKSMTATWSIIECLPIKRPIYPINGDKSSTWVPHFFARRRILPYQRIHQSVYEECLHFEAPEYVAEELDPYLVLRSQDEVLRTGRILNPQSRMTLKKLASSENGIKSLDTLGITQYIYDVARLCRDNSAVRSQTWQDLQEFHVAFVKGSFRVNHMVVRQATKIPRPQQSGIFPFHMCGHAGRVSSIAFLSETQVLTGSYDKTLRIWDVGTGEMILGGPLRGHIDDINCVAVHPAKGLLASASNDSTIRLYTSDDSTGSVHAGKVLRNGRGHWVLAVAFSPDGSHLISGSEDRTIRVWSTATGEPVGEPVRGHTDWVLSLASSSDGKQVVSGSSDHTVRLWEWSSSETTLRPCGGPLLGHTDFVHSVAISMDGRLIASGSLDKTICLWDAGARTPRFTLTNHTEKVNSVAFAPDGAYLVSGSDDWTVRIWDTRTGAALSVLQGHTHEVWAVAVSPDGTRIASGSRDKTVRVWEFAPDCDESQPDEDVQGAQTQVTSI